MAMRNRHLLVALLAYSEREGFKFHSVQQVCLAANLSFPEGLVELLVEQLVESGDLLASERVLDEPVANRVFETTIKLTGKGLTSAEIWRGPLERKRPIPASDRYVSIADNQRAALMDDLDALRSEALGSNEVSEEDRLIARSEIAAFEATLMQPRVSTDLIQRFVDMVLAWIQRTFTAAAVQEVAQRLIQALLKLIA